MACVSGRLHGGHIISMCMCAILKDQKECELHVSQSQRTFSTLHMNFSNWPMGGSQKPEVDCYERLRPERPLESLCEDEQNCIRCSQTIQSLSISCDDSLDMFMALLLQSDAGLLHDW